MVLITDGTTINQLDTTPACNTQADQKNSLVSGPPTDPATTPPTVNFLQQSEQKGFFMAKKN